MRKVTDRFSIASGYSNNRVLVARSKTHTQRLSHYQPTKLYAIRVYGWYARGTTMWDYSHELEYVQGIGLI